MRPRRLVTGLAPALLLAVARAATAVCTVPNAVVLQACHVSDLELAGCCGSTSCTLDGTITVTGTTCDFDFGARNVVLQATGGQANTGVFNVGTSSVTIEAGTFRIKGGQLLARGTASTAGGTGTAGGTVTITTTDTGAAATCAPNTVPSFSLESIVGGGSPLIDLSGGGPTGAGTLMLYAARAACLTSGGITADGLGTPPFGAPGGLVLLSAAAGDLTLGGGVTLSVRGGSQNGGAIDLLAPAGTVNLGNGTQLLADGTDGASADGGTVDVVGGTVTALGVITATGGMSADTIHPGGDGGAVTLDARTGPLLLKHVGGGVNLTSAPGGSGGTVTLRTRALTDPASDGTSLTISAPITAAADENPDLSGGAGGEITVESAGNVVINNTIDVTGKGYGGAEVTLTAVRDVVVNAPLQGQDEGDGAMLTIQSGNNVSVNAPVSFGTVTNFSGSGGEVDITAGEDINVAAGIDASGALDGDGGQINLLAARNLMVSSGGGSVSSNGGTTGTGGDVTLAAGETDVVTGMTGDLTVNGTVTATSVSGDASRSSVTLHGCQITIAGHVDTRGGAAVNDVRARKQLSVVGSGTVRTTVGMGKNMFTYPLGAPFAPPNGSVTPSPTISTPPSCTTDANTPQPGCLPQCRTCGDKSVDYPETCDNGLDAHCGGCRHCQTALEPARPAICDDGEVCHYHLCDPVGGCFNDPLPDGTPCGGDDCTGPSFCRDGDCIPTRPPPAGCAQGCTPGHLCDDGDDCTDDTCDSAAGTCRHDPIPGCCNALPTHSCDPEHTNICSVCTNHTCGNLDHCCTADSDCDDGNPCTQDGCNTSTHQCNAPVLLSGAQPGCGDLCTPFAACVIAGNTSQCQLGTPKDCTPAMPDPCYAYFCDSAQGCVQHFMDGCCEPTDTCDDGHPCTKDECDAGTNTCTHEVMSGCRECKADVDCDATDTHLCGSSICNLQTGECEPNPQQIVCNDHNLDTSDECVSRSAGDPPHCEYHCLNDRACNDGDVCNGTARCVDGACVADQPPLACADHDFCTDDSCDPATGCVHQQKLGLDSITCQLANFDAALGNVGPTDVPKGAKKKIGKMLATARAKVNAAVSAARAHNLKTEGKALKTATKQLAALAKFIAKQRKISAAIAGPLAAAAQQASQAADFVGKHLST